MSKLKRELGAADLVANYGYEGVEAVENGFDAKYPWNGMSRITDKKGNVWIRIPKFYTKYDLDKEGHVCGRYISQYNVSNDWHLNPIFLDKSGRELPYVEISAYLAHVDTVTNSIFCKPGDMPTRGKKLAEMRPIVNKMSLEDATYDYYLYNIWASILEQDLFLIEFANSNTTEVLSGMSYGAYSKLYARNGETDIIPYVSGVVSEIENEHKTSPMKYRSLENVIGNGHLVMDNIKIVTAGIEVDTNGIKTISKLPKLQVNGLVSKLGYDEENKLIFPVAVSEKGSYGDIFSIEGSDNLVISRGINKDEGYGLFCYNCYSANAVDPHAVYRIIRRPTI